MKRGITVEMWLWNDGKHVLEISTKCAPAEAFQAIYVALLGKPRGPRAGWFVTVVGAETCAARFRQAAA